MVPVHPNPNDESQFYTGGGASGDSASDAGAGAPGGPGGRLNLLLSCASWRVDSWADRLPFLLEPMGVHSVRARSAKQAERVIRTVTVHIAVVDLGLPMDEPDVRGGAEGGGELGSNRVREGGTGGAGAEEAGPRILELLKRLDSPPPTVIVKGSCTQRDETRNLAAALRSGAFAVVDRSAVDLEQMLEVLRRCLRRFYQDRWPGG